VYVSTQQLLAPSFADAQMSVLFPLGVCYSAGEWRQAPAYGGIVMGALTRATHLSGDRVGMVGAYLTPRGSAALFQVPAAELNDRTVSIGDLWKGADIDPECATIDALEVLLVRRLTSASVRSSAVRTGDLAAHVLRGGGQTTVERMAGLAGVSRQHLARLFREHIGVSPKLYARLARFRHSIREVGRSAPVASWSRFAARHGYADQSHLIADWRQFTGLTPAQLARGDRFHPFIGDESDSPTP
jgi:AraC-like DNA-binding protein